MYLTSDWGSMEILTENPKKFFDQWINLERYVRLEMWNQLCSTPDFTWKFTAVTKINVFFPQYLIRKKTFFLASLCKIYGHKLVLYVLNPQFKKLHWTNNWYYFYFVEEEKKDTQTSWSAEIYCKCFMLKRNQMHQSGTKCVRKIVHTFRFESCYVQTKKNPAHFVITARSATQWITFSSRSAINKCGH